MFFYFMARYCTYQWLAHGVGPQADQGDGWENIAGLDSAIPPGVGKIPDIGFGVES